MSLSLFFFFFEKPEEVSSGRWLPGLSDEGISFVVGTTALSCHYHPQSEMKSHFGKTHVMKENVFFM